MRPTLSSTNRRRVAWLSVLTLTATGLLRAADRTAPQVITFYPHDTGAFTQGLLLHQGSFFESTGLYGQSTLRRVDPLTGSVLQQRDLAADDFGEGLARVGDRLIQLTFRESVAYVYDQLRFSLLDSFSYAGEGWGLCHDGERLVMSNGGSNLFFRDPDTFEILEQVQVTLDGGPIDRLNELECVGRIVYANVWLTDTILRIDPATGIVLTEIDASGLLTPQEALQADVLNGIAFDPATEHFFLTGKFWPKVFEVTFDFDPYGNDACEVSGLTEVAGVRAVKDGANGVTFSWQPGPVATQYHLNSVSSRDHLLPPGPHRTDVPGGFGVAQCDVPHPGTSCTDADGLSDPEPLLFYQVFSACGASGAAEGPP